MTRLGRLGQWWRGEPHGRPVLSEGPIIRTIEFLNAALMLVVIGLVLFALLAYNHTLDQIKGERHTAIAITCALLSATTEAGKEAITGGVLPENHFTRELERLGYPPYPIRKKQARDAANAYVQFLTTRASTAIGAQAHDLVGPGGNLDCHQFARLSGAR